jgi:hypothetical protein
MVLAVAAATVLSGPAQDLYRVAGKIFRLRHPPGN